MSPHHGQGDLFIPCSSHPAPHSRAFPHRDLSRACSFCRWINCGCCSWKKRMRICSSLTSTWSRYGEPQGAALAPLIESEWLWVGRDHKDHRVPTLLMWAGVPFPFWSGPCPSLEHSPDRHLPPPQVRGLEMKLHHTQKVLRTHEKMQEKMKEVRFMVHCSPLL